MKINHIVSQNITEGLRDPADNPCWKGYHPVGTKKKDGRTVPNCVPKESVEEASPEATFNALKGLKSWQVMILNNFYNGKYPDYSGRTYYVLATSPEEARQVVLDNADGILQDLLSMKSHNGKKILPRNSAVRITPERVIRIKDGTEHGRMSTAGFKKMYGPQGPMMVKLSNGAVADVQDQEQGVAEGMDDDLNDYYAGYYTDLLSQIQNMSFTDRVDTKLGIKRSLENGELRLVDLKSEIRALDREIIRTKQGVAEGDISQLEKDVADAPVEPIANMEGVADSNVEELGADAGEYDYEGDMAKDDLETIVRAARQLTGMISDNENMPEWVQSKINKAADYVDTAADYMASNQDEPMDEAQQEKIGGRHDPQDFDDMVSRLKKLAGAGPMKTVYDPNTRRYKNMPTAVQPGDKK